MKPPSRWFQGRGQRFKKVVAHPIDSRTERAAEMDFAIVGGTMSRPGSRKSFKRLPALHSEAAIAVPVMSWEVDMELQAWSSKPGTRGWQWEVNGLELKSSASAPGGLRYGNAGNETDRRRPVGLEEIDRVIGDLATSTSCEPHVVPTKQLAQAAGWSTKQADDVRWRVEAKAKWRQMGSKISMIVAMHEFVEENRVEKPEEVEVESKNLPKHYGAVPGPVVEEVDARALWRHAAKRVNHARAFKRPATPLARVAGKVYTETNGPPKPIQSSTDQFDKLHRKLARRSRLAMKALDDDPHGKKSYDKFTNTLGELFRSRHVLNAPTEHGAALYPDAVWGISPEHLNDLAGERHLSETLRPALPEGRSPRRGVSPPEVVARHRGIAFIETRHMHRGGKVRSLRPSLPVVRPGPHSTVHKLLPDSHFALGTFNKQTQHGWRDKNVKWKHYKTPGAAAAMEADEQVRRAAEMEEARKRAVAAAAENPREPADEWAHGGVQHHLIFGGPSDDEVMRRLATGEESSSEDDEDDLMLGMESPGGNAGGGPSRRPPGDGRGGGRGGGGGGGGGGRGGTQNVGKDSGYGVGIFAAGSGDGGAPIGGRHFNFWKGSVDEGMSDPMPPDFAWLEKSVWRARKHGPRASDARDYVDNEPCLRDAFRQDWSVTSGATFLKQKEDPNFKDEPRRPFNSTSMTVAVVKKIEEALERYYPLLLRVFAFYSCVGADVNNIINGIPLMGYGLLIADARLDIESVGEKARHARPRGEDGWDLIWVAVNESKESLSQWYNSKTRFTRAELLEWVVRAATDKKDVDTMAACVSEFCEDLHKFLSRHNEAAIILHQPDAFRREFCYTRQTNAMLTHHEESLRNIFSVYAEHGTGGFDPESSVDLMTAAEWMALMADVGFVKEVGYRNLYLAFAQARMATIDEGSRKSKGVHLTQLPYEGFLEAIVRLSLLKALPTDKEMKKKGFQFPGEYIGAILFRGVPLYEAWVILSKKMQAAGKGDPVYRRIDMLVLLIISVMQFGVEQQKGGPKLLLRGSPDEKLQHIEVLKYHRKPTRDIFEGPAPEE